MTYAEKLKDPRWQKKRLEILQRDNWTCQVCGDKESTLYVHHKIYSSGQEPWECKNSLLVTLCGDCHDEEHSVGKEYQEVLMSELFGKGLLGIDMLDLAFAISNTPKEKLYALAGVSTKRIKLMHVDAKVTP